MWFMVTYPQSIIDENYSISQLELLNTMIALKVFGHVLQGKIVHVRCDNAAAVSVVSTGRAKCKVLLQISREVWRITANNKIEIQVSHIKGQDNDLADLLSRAHKSKALSEKVWARAREDNAKMLSVTRDMYKF